MIIGTIAFSQDTTKLAKNHMATTNLDLQKDSVYYTCTMHPNVKLDKPGKCPECGMEVIPEEVEEIEG
jgi:hypothetical protein